MTRAWLLPGLAALTVGTASVPFSAHAAEPSSTTRAAAKFAEGEAAFGAGDFVRAAEAFDAAYQIAPHHDAIWNAARAWQKAGEAARAANRYARYLQESPPDATDRGRATTTLVQLASRLGRIEITVPEGAEVWVDGQPSDARTAYVVPGAHVVRIRTAGAEEEIATWVGAGATVSVARGATAALPAAPPPAPTEERSEVTDAAARRAGPSPLEPEVSSEGAPRRRGLPPAVVFGAGVASLATFAFATWSGLDTLAARDDFDANPTEANLERGRGKQLRTNVLLGVGGGLTLLTAAAAIFWVDWGTSGRKISLGVSPNGASIRAVF